MKHLIKKELKILFKEYDSEISLDKRDEILTNIMSLSLLHKITQL
jgi:hypothetical protein